MKTWNDCKNILCIRPDNMGDLLMSGPAIRALKQTFNAHITVLTSSVAAGITRFMPEIDDVMVFDVPWVKSEQPSDQTEIAALLSILRSKNFDAAVIFTVFSQNPLPTVMLAYQAGIPRILAYCRENPYGLVTDWVPDEEPYTLIRHQVERDLHLVKSIGATVTERGLQLKTPDDMWPIIKEKLEYLHLDLSSPWLLLHAGVSEIKRQYPAKLWIETGKILIDKGYQLVLTGTAAEAELTQNIKQGIGDGAIDTAGQFGLNELICLIKESKLLLSVNTGTVHIAAAVNTPVVVLYAQTNPQHTPWQAPSRVLQFPVSEELQSKNEVIRYLQKNIYSQSATMPRPACVAEAVEELLKPSAEPTLLSPEIPIQNRAIAAS